MPHKAEYHSTKYVAINDDKLFLTVCRRIYCCKFVTLSDQTSSYKNKCIRINVEQPHVIRQVASDYIVMLK